MSEKRQNKFKRQIDSVSKRWGKDKFKPAPFVRRAPAPPPVPETAKPWQHVKNDILDDEEELRSSNRCNMDSQQAKEVMKQREQNHRRNIIEAKRNEKTIWEKFDDDDDGVKSVPRSSKTKVKSKINKTNPKDLKFWERNLLRQKLTKIANQKYNKTSMDEMINNLKRTNHCAGPKNFKKFADKKK